MLNTLYVFVKLLRNQSWVNLLFSVLRDSILGSILDSRSNRDWQQTVNLLLNGTVYSMHIIISSVSIIKYLDHWTSSSSSLVKPAR